MLRLIIRQKTAKDGWILTPIKYDQKAFGTRENGLFYGTVYNTGELVGSCSISLNGCEYKNFISYDNSYYIIMGKDDESNPHKAFKIPTEIILNSGSDEIIMDDCFSKPLSFINIDYFYKSFLESLKGFEKIRIYNDIEIYPASTGTNPDPEINITRKKIETDLLDAVKNSCNSS